MSWVPIYTSLKFPAAASPSLTSLQWSSDGQLFILTKETIYVMTPKYLEAIQAPKTRPLSHEKAPDWFRTVIEFDKNNVQDWRDVSQEWGAVSFGSFDIGLKAVAVSPIGLAKDGGCIAAVLTSNMDLSLWAPDKNRMQGNWSKIQEITPLLSAARSALRGQATGITWSRQADFGIDPAPPIDASLLAVGTRGGTVMFLRFENGAVSCLDEIKVADNWLTQLCFSPWSLVENGKCESRLACGTSDGGVKLLTVSQTLTFTPTGFGPTFTIERHFRLDVESVFDPDKRYLTALTWIICKGCRILVMCKPGLVSLIAPPVCSLGWSGRLTLPFRTQIVSVGSSPLHSVSGVHYVPVHDAVLICLSDGSIHVIHCVSSEPSWATEGPKPKDGLTSLRLTRNARLIFNKTQHAKTKHTDVNHVHGAIPFTACGSFLWLQELRQPTNLDYKYNAKTQTTFVAAQLWRTPLNDVFLRELSTILTTAKTAQGAPNYQLGPFFFHLVNHLELYPDILHALKYPPTTSMDFSFHDVQSPSSILFGPSLRQAFRDSLSRYFFHSNLLLRLRLKLSVAEVMLRSLGESPVRAECERTACYLFDTISQIILRILIRHLTPVATVLTLNDAPFTLRLSSQAMSPGRLPGLVAEGKALADSLPTTFTSLSMQVEPTSEFCPACNAIILLGSGASAICANGHSWGRCSITSFILTTGMVRRCTGCNRKALLPLSSKASADVQNWIPTQAQSWVVEELLEAAARCLFCGNIFVSAH